MILFLNQFKEYKKAQRNRGAYTLKLKQMNKTELLEELIEFQKKRSTFDSISLEMIIQGEVLFEALILHCESIEMQKFSKTYLKHLKYELQHLLTKKLQ
jgi:metal-responsive CopG/Arc/MetJ family transcriptional regulator